MNTHNYNIEAIAKALDLQRVDVIDYLQLCLISGRNFIVTRNSESTLRKGRTIEGSGRTADDAAEAYHRVVGTALLPVLVEIKSDSSISTLFAVGAPLPK
jgi:hypothetical protein